ncbi:MAG: hypothetical protein MZV63_28880 [Marinilabiliales bacterium]|nr:hypothetical protein [Marinilabiliales bacterium]
MGVDSIIDVVRRSWCVMKSTQYATRTTPGVDMPQPLSTVRLLLVEDNASLRAAMKSGLEETGKVTVIAETDRGAGAIGLALADRPRRDFDGCAAGGRHQRRAGRRRHPA